MEQFNLFKDYVDNLMESPNQGIGTYVEINAKEKPDKIAIYFEDSSLTWKAVNEESNKIANYFKQLGLKRGETISIMLENSPEFLMIITGINKIQGVCALTNNNQRQQALSHSFNTVEPKYIIIDGDSLDAFENIVNDLSISKEKIYVVNNPENKAHDYLSLEEAIKDIETTNPDTTFESILRETALYIFTSGTTGLPKAVIMQNYKMLGQCGLLNITFAKLTSEDIIYINTPLYHNVGLGLGWMDTIILGATCVLRKRFSASSFWKDIYDYKVTFTNYVGEFARYLLNQPPSEYEKGHTLKKMCGLGLKKDIWLKFQERFKLQHIFEYYGMTEAVRGCLNVEEIPGMVGRLNQPGMFLVKVNPETGEFYRNNRGFLIKCKPGDIGMAITKITSNSMFTGYRNSDMTDKKMLHNVFRKDDKYFNSGDMLKLHEDQYVSFADRFGDTYRWKAENVSTMEVESIINSSDTIHYISVYGVPIPNTEGKAGMASVSLNPSKEFNIDDFSQFLVEVLPSYSIPVFLRICKELETTGSLKIRKVDLQKEGYNIEEINDKIYFWAPSKKKYTPLTPEIYQQLITGNYMDL